jgi:hypothetical protein
MNLKYLCHYFFQKFFITTEILQQDRHERDLSELRVDLLRSTAIKLLEATGYELADMGECFKEESTVCLHFSTKSSEVVPGCQRVLCGVVVNSRHHNKDNTITAQEYVRCVCHVVELCLAAAVFPSVFTVHVKVVVLQVRVNAFDFCSREM